MEEKELFQMGTSEVLMILCFGTMAEKPLEPWPQICLQFRKAMAFYYISMKCLPVFEGTGKLDSNVSVSPHLPNRNSCILQPEVPT